MSRDRWRDKNVTTFLANSVRPFQDNSAPMCLVKLVRSKSLTGQPMIGILTFNF